jgi:hypothetical protein
MPHVPDVNERVSSAVYRASHKAGYQHDFAIQVAEAGMAAVAIDPLASGAGRDGHPRK